MSVINWRVVKCLCPVPNIEKSRRTCWHSRLATSYRCKNKERKKVMAI